jgi:hypothetical protein
MAKLTITIEMETPAFGGEDFEEAAVRAAEVAHILREYADTIEQTAELNQSLQDTNNNTLGKAEYAEN